MRAPDEIIERTVIVTAVEPHAGHDLRQSWWEVSTDDGWTYPIVLLEYAPLIGDRLTVWLRGGAVLEAFRFNNGPTIRRISAGVGWGTDAAFSSPRGEAIW